MTEQEWTRVLQNLFRAFRGLSPKEREIIVMRNGLLDAIPHTLEEVGKHYGVTRERIRQIEFKSYDWLAKAFNDLQINHLVHHDFCEECHDCGCKCKHLKSALKSPLNKEIK